MIPFDFLMDFLMAEDAWRGIDCYKVLDKEKHDERISVKDGNQTLKS